MKKYEIILFGDMEDSKFFKTKNSRITLIEFDAKKLDKMKNDLKKEFKFHSGLYILEQISDEQKVYIGEAEDVWNRIKDHINGRTQITKSGKHDKINIERITLILSSDGFNEFSKGDLHSLERMLINEFDLLRNSIKLINNNKGIKSNNNFMKERQDEQEFEFIKYGLYALGKDYFINVIDNEELDKINVDDSLNENKENEEYQLVDIYPIPNEKRQVKISEKAKFEFSPLNKIIKIHKGTKIVGKIMGSKTNLDIFNVYKNKLIKSKGAEIKFDEKTSKYEVEFISDAFMKPSSIGIFIRGGINRGWTFWEDKDGQLIDKYR